LDFTQATTPSRKTSEDGELIQIEDTKKFAGNSLFGVRAMKDKLTSKCGK